MFTLIRLEPIDPSLVRAEAGFHPRSCLLDARRPKERAVVRARQGLDTSLDKP